MVDDACPEHSADVLVPISDARILVIRHTLNQGVGGATLSGLRCAIQDGCEIIVKMDGDGQMDPLYLRDLCDPIAAGMCDFAKGSRFVHLASLRSMPFVRRAGNIGLNFLTKFASGQWHISDPTDGYLAVHREAAKVFNADRISRRFFFEISLLIRLNIIRAVALDIAIPAHYNNDRSSLNVTRCFLGFPPRLIWGFLNRLFWRYYFYDVNATTLCLSVGLVSTGFGVGFGLFRWFTGVHSGQLQSADTVALSLLPTIVGVQLVLQALVLDVIDRPYLPISRLLGSQIEWLDQPARSRSGFRLFHPRSKNAE